MKKIILLFAALLAYAGFALAAVNVNSATKEQLESLNGIGPVKAQAIIDYRAKNGPFKKLEDLKNVDGIGDATFEKIRGDVSLSGRTDVKADAKPAADKKAEPAPAKAEKAKPEEKKAKEEPKAKKEEPKAAKPSKADADKAKKDEEKAKKEEAKAKKEADAKAKKDAEKAKKDAAKAKKDEAKKDEEKKK